VTSTGQKKHELEWVVLQKLSEDKRSTGLGSVYAATEKILAMNFT
jgi:hypothetical protein